MPERRLRRSLICIVRLNCETRKSAIYGPSPVVSKPTLFETSVEGGAYDLSFRLSATAHVLGLRKESSNET